MSKKLDKLAAETKRLTEEKERLRKLESKVRNRLYLIEKEVEREQLRQLIGMPNGVRHRYRGMDPKQPWMDNTAGTLLAVRRIMGSVDYGEHGVWEIPLAYLMPADGTQGFVIPVRCA
jgi:hypothetical protein